MRARLQLVAAWAPVALALASAGTAYAVSEESSIWTGAGADNNWTTLLNWQSGTAPVNNGSANVSIDTMRRYLVSLDTSQAINSLSISGKYHEFGASDATLTIGSGGLYAEETTFDSSLTIALNASQVWDIPASNGDDDNIKVRVNSSLSGSEITLTKSGGGRLVLNAANNLDSASTFVLSEGSLWLGDDSALGSATLAVAAGDCVPTIGTSGAARTITNNITLNAYTLNVDTTGGTLTLAGHVTLGAPTNLNIVGPNPVVLTGTLFESGGAQTLYLNGSGTLVVQGTIATMGGAVVSSGILRLDPTACLTGSGSFTVYDGGYIGTSTTDPAAFLNLFDKENSTGSLGFDNGVTITNPINLSGFSSTIRLGSSTTATLSSTATITPLYSDHGDYHFGGGGGLLRVESDLTNQLGTCGVSVKSPSGQALSLVLAGTNSYTRGTTIDNSVLRFANSNAFPTSGSFTINDYGYLGFDYDVDLAALSLFSRVTNNGTFIFGADSPNTLSQRNVPLSTDLGYLPTGTILGTSTAATLEITKGDSSPASLSFAAVKDGQLKISLLPPGGTYTYSVTIGLPNDDSPDSPPGTLASWKSTVTLQGPNTYTGGTTLKGGRLQLGNASALGTGSLTVDGNATLATTDSLASPITTTISFSGFHDLHLDSGASNNFTLSGPISGSGSLIKEGTGTVTLSGSVHLTGGDGPVDGHEVREGTLEIANLFTTDGLLILHDGATLNVTNSVAMTIGGLESKDDTVSSSATINLGTGATLTLGGDTNDENAFFGVIHGAGSLIKTGSSIQYLGALPGPSLSDYSGGTSIQGGALLVTSNGALGTGPVSINVSPANYGGLGVFNGVTLTNSLTLTSGTLAGYGTFAPSNGAIIVGASRIIQPGAIFSEPSALGFGTGLVLASGGTYVWEISYALGTPGIEWDKLAVTGSLTFDATSEIPFTVEIYPVGEGPSGFDNTASYSWIIASATGGITGFDTSVVTLDTSNVGADLGVGHFFLSQSSNDLLVNFTPVPEPSMSALLGLGLAGLLFRFWRRRR